jgi:hypothetical protein
MAASCELYERGQKAPHFSCRKEMGCQAAILIGCTPIPVVRPLGNMPDRLSENPSENKDKMQVIFDE